MRVDHHPSRAAGAIESLLHQHVTLFKPGFSNRIHCRGISISNFQLSIVCVSNTRATIYICGKAELYTFGQVWVLTMCEHEYINAFIKDIDRKLFRKSLLHRIDVFGVQKPIDDHHR